MPPSVVYKLWSDAQRYPQWMDHLLRVEPLGPRASRWTMRRRDGGTVTWKTEMTVLEPDVRVAWSSVEGDLVTYGKVTLEPRGRGTRVTLERFHGFSRWQDPSVLPEEFSDPQRKLDQDLWRFKEYLHRLVQRHRNGASAPRVQANGPVSVQGVRRRSAGSVAHARRERARRAGGRGGRRRARR